MKTPSNQTAFKGAEHKAEYRLYHQLLIIRSPRPEWLDSLPREFEWLDEHHVMVHGQGEFFAPLLRAGAVAVCTQGIMHPTDWDNSRLDLTRLNNVVESLRNEVAP
jgi:hypothetical protein